MRSMTVWDFHGFYLALGRIILRYGMAGHIAYRFNWCVTPICDLGLKRFEARYQSR
jgi:hypothetical protein